MTEMCAICNQKVLYSHEVILCDECEILKHRQCILMSMKTFRNISESKEPWKCDPCNTEVNAKKSTKEYSIDDLMEKLFEMDQNCNRLFTKYKEQLQINERIQNELSATKKELNNQEQMGLNNNIIVNGIP
ncbi:hypothetical protein HHI36_003127 [Cryptolaemus montrouzieri]|uniref:PHD-type domain-containing protein n=1 Tax=Cryptolaemus montrouzieri TaxID=559131 RepID=A0ABD2PCJ1_9CUCU